MKNLKFLNFLFLVSIMLVLSCSDDASIVPDPNPDPDTGSPGLLEIPEVLITASIMGSIVDAAEIPLEDVLVRVGPNTTSTDEYGEFSFSNIELNQNGALVSAEKDGFFSNTKLVITNANQVSITKMLLIEKVVTSTFAASSGGTSTMNGGAKVMIPAAGIQLEAGGAYSGNVNVYATWLDPTADDLSLRMPGDLRATNAEDEVVKLETYGMIGVELEGDNGEPLNIAEGQTATIEIPVPASLLGSAPSTIPLWHLDEATGYWIEEGEATLTGNVYVGQVSHFSFWNVDVPHQFVEISGTITDNRQNTLSGVAVVITMESNGETGYGYTDMNGLYEGFVPADQILTITVYNDCGAEVYSGEIGPFTESVVIPDIAISPSSNSFLTVTGTLQDCNMEVETDGYVVVDFGGLRDSYIGVDSDGAFNETISVCDQIEVTISGISNDPFSQGTTTTYDISGSPELNVGTLITCW